MRDGGGSGWRPWAAMAAICALSGCDLANEAALGADGGVDTGTGDGWESPFDGSVWDTDPDDDVDTEAPCDCASEPLCGIERTCLSGVEECECGAVCDDGYYASLGWGPSLDDYLCYEPCGDGAACHREGDECTELSDGESLCLPRISAASEGFDVKVVPGEQMGSITDAAQVDVALTEGGETRHLIMAFASASGAEVDLGIMESGVGEYDYLYLQIPLTEWAPGTLSVSAEDLAASLYRITGSGDMWLVGYAAAGTVELTETPEIAACDGPGCPKALFGALQLDFYGLEASFPEE